MGWSTLQIDYILKMIKPVLSKQVSAFNVKHAPTNEYNEKIHARLGKSVFMGCSSWYRRGGNGKVSSIFPGAGSVFYLWLRRVKWSDYEVIGGRGEAAWMKTVNRKGLAHFLNFFFLPVALLAALFLTGRTQGKFESTYLSRSVKSY